MAWHLVVTLSSLWFGVAHGSRCPYGDTLEAGGCWPGISGVHSCQGLQRAWVGASLSWGAGGAGQQELMALGGAGQCSGSGWAGWEAAMQRGEQGKGLCCGGVTGLSWAGCTAVLQRVGPTGRAPPAPEQSCQHSCGSSASPPSEPVSWALTMGQCCAKQGARGQPAVALHPHSQSVLPAWPCSMKFPSLLPWPSAAICLPGPPRHLAARLLHLTSHRVPGVAVPPHLVQHRQHLAMPLACAEALLQAAACSVHSWAWGGVGRVCCAGLLVGGCALPHSPCHP